MGLLAQAIADSDGIVRSSTYGRLGEHFPRNGHGELNFAAALGLVCAFYDERNYQRVVMLMTGGFAD